MTSIRPAAVAGFFYPGDSSTLNTELGRLLSTVVAPQTELPKALIVPHAGYIYSGPTAAHAYAGLDAYRERIKRVVLLGPAHRVAIRGLAAPTVTEFATPLGRVPIDLPALASLKDLPQFSLSDAAHAQEHSIEVHLPFLQHLLGSFSLVPIVVGDASPAEVAQVLDRLWGGDETLIVVSSDLSHYLSYDSASKTDRETTQRVLAFGSGLTHHQACGATPINGLLDVARRRALRPQLLDLRNSGDTAGDKRRVVGYASIAFYPSSRTDAQKNNAIDGQHLLLIARSSIKEQFGLHFPVNHDASYLHQSAATFVTLKTQGRLRGCIGSLAAHRSLLADVRANAQAAAFRDPRFPALRLEELAALNVEVSVLSALSPLSFQSESDALSQLQPGEDGLVLEFGTHRGTFLPQVWESLVKPADFLGELKRKAGLARDFWHDSIRLSRYSVAKWAELESDS
jgi:MEMO1 family protein